MIRNDLAIRADKALDMLAAKAPPPPVKAALDRLKRVLSTYREAKDYFNPLDFTEADLRDGAAELETAAKKAWRAFEPAAGPCHGAFRTCMQAANTPEERVGCRVNLVVALAEAITKLVPSA